MHAGGGGIDAKQTLQLALCGVDQFATVAGGTELEEGEAAIIKGSGDDRFTIVGRIKSDDWRELQRAQK